jgi:hypothetical protein
MNKVVVSRPRTAGKNTEAAAIEELLRRPPSTGRGTGQTTAQMQRAPQGCVFVCVHDSALGYTEDLAGHLGRTDLVIKPLSWARGEGYRGLNKPIMFDHAVEVGVDTRLFACITHFARKGLIHG